MNRAEFRMLGALERRHPRPRRSKRERMGFWFTRAVLPATVLGALILGGLRLAGAF